MSECQFPMFFSPHAQTLLERATRIELRMEDANKGRCYFLVDGAWVVLAARQKRTGTVIEMYAGNRVGDHVSEPVAESQDEPVFYKGSESQWLVSIGEGTGGLVMDKHRARAPLPKSITPDQATELVGAMSRVYEIERVACENPPQEIPTPTPASPMREDQDELITLSRALARGTAWE